MQEKKACSGTDLEGLVNISRCVEGVLAGVTLKQTGVDTYKASLRTYDPLNASKICKSLGGGGHKNAAGVSLSGELQEVKDKILSAVKQNMEEANAGSFTA